MRIKYNPQILVRSIALKGFCTGNLEVNKFSFLNVSGMMQKSKLAASIVCQGFCQFRQRLITKIVARGETIVLAKQWFP